MKSLTKVICLVSALMCGVMFGLFALTACGKIAYNAVLYSHAQEWVDEEFLKENRVCAYYPNDDYIEGENDYIYVDDAPSELTFVITEQAEFDEIFTKYMSSVDFNNQLVILYILSDVYALRDYQLKDIKLENDVLEFYYELERKKNNIQDASMPYPRCFMLIMDKVNFSDVRFIEQ